MSSQSDNQASPDARCPICAKAATADYAPFCSRRCADIDLHRWLAGAYAIPAAEDESVASERDEEDS